MCDDIERYLEPGKEDGFDIPQKDTSWEAICAVIDARLSADTGTGRDPAVQQGYTDLVTVADRIIKRGKGYATDE